jgi:hypothetical protein
MNLRRRHRNEGYIMMGDSLALLAPIVATCAMILLWFFG